MSGLPLFPDMPEDTPVPNLSKARLLVAEVYDLQGAMDGFYEECARVRGLALRMGAHSVARACVWLGTFESFERYGYDHVHITAEKVADRWLKRVEEARR